jgi:predicted PolB exonuclease-like 3'-5' exonuclease
MDIALAVVYDVTADNYLFFGHGEYERIRLLETIQKADRLTSYNGWQFDLPVICRVDRDTWANKKGGPVQAILEKSNDDLFLRVQSSAERHPSWKPHRGRLSLNALSRSNLNKEKNGDPTEVTKLFDQGKILQIAEYCLQDVRLTYQLLQHIEKTGQVAIPGRPKIITGMDSWTRKSG